MGLATRRAFLIVMFSVTAVLVAGCPPALTIQSGLDLYETAEDNSKGGPPQVLIEASIIEVTSSQIPENFFDVGSDPFSGKIELQGMPLGTSTQCDSNLGITDTIIERKQDADLPYIDSSATVAIELLELSLVGRKPITVTYNNSSNTEKWNLHITLTPQMTSTGATTIQRTGRDGGVFDSVLNVYPRLTFIRKSDDTMRVLDLQDTLITDRARWLKNVPGVELPSDCQSNFVPSLGRIPVIGRLFTNKIEMRGENLLIFVTPHIIINESSEP